MNVLRDIDDLELCVEKSSLGFMGTKSVREADWTAHLETLRASLLSLRYLDEAGRAKIEEYLAQLRALTVGKPPILGRVWISEEQFFMRVQMLRAELPKIMADAEKSGQNPQNASAENENTAQRQTVGAEEFLRAPETFLERAKNGESFQIVRAGETVARLESG